MGVWGVVLSVMHVVGGGGILLVVCVFRRVECRCCVLGSVAILSAVFCVICSLFMFVSDVCGDHIVEAPNDSLHTGAGAVTAVWQTSVQIGARFTVF